MENTNYFSYFRRYLIELNLFKSNRIDVHSLSIERWSTRLYIPLLFFALLTLLIYTIFDVHSEQIQIENPSLTMYRHLYEKYPNVKCPCRHVSIDYKNFLDLNIDLHEICSSSLISSEWISSLYLKEQTTIRYAIDFRATAFNQFSLLRDLCQLSIDTIQNEKIDFYENQLISGELFNENLFRAQIQSDVESFQRIVTSNYLRSLLLMRQFMRGNELLTDVQTAYTFIRNTEEDIILNTPPLYTNTYTDVDGSTCDCSNNMGCKISAGFYDIERTYVENANFIWNAIEAIEYIDGWKIACWPLESLYISTLASFSNQTKFNRILEYLNLSNTNEFFPLNQWENSKYNMTNSIEILIENLFIENLSEILNYSSYYAECQPLFCEYTENHRSELTYIFTSLISFYGGLSVILHFVIPHLIQWIYEKTRQQNNQRRTSFQQQIKNLFQTIVNLNLYQSLLKITEKDIKHQQWSTRIYLISFSICVFILTIYSSIVIQLQIIEITNPTLNEILKLEDQDYSLVCPCERLSISYEYLFEIEPYFHPICSSEFVSLKWIEYLNEIKGLYPYNYDNTDYRSISPSMYYLLDMLCSLSSTTITNQLFQFQQTKFISNNLLDRNLFIEKLNSSIEKFKQSLPKDFLRLIELIRNLTYVNQFISGGYSNFLIELTFDKQTEEINGRLKTDGLPYFLVTPNEIKCLCANNITCETNVTLLNYDENNEPINIVYSTNSFYTRCYPIESLLASTLECLFVNETCYDILHNMTDQLKYENFTQLDPSKLYHFRKNHSIDNLIFELFVDLWFVNYNYSSYFDQCQSKSCSYRIFQRKNFLEILRVLTGSIGGLSTVLKIISPYGISMIFYFIYRIQRRREEEEEEEEQTNEIHDRNFLVKIISFLLNLNLFAEDNGLRYQRQSTRLYLLLFIVILLVLVTYTSLIYRSNQIDTSVVSLQDFIQFQQQHQSDIITCPCAQLSTTYSTFYEIEPRFHQICSSDFIDSNWLNLLFQSYRNLPSLEVNTFIGTAFGHFQSISILCQLIEDFVIDSRDLLLQEILVSSEMVNKDIFDLNTNSTIEYFQSSLSKEFLQSFNMFRRLSQSSGFISVFSTNWQPLLFNLTIDPTVYFISQTYDQCDCALSLSCIENSQPFIPGYVVGCLPLESSLQSTFECLYNQSCIKQILILLNQTSFDRKLLNQTQTQYPIDILINDLVQHMFIESWSINISYENYFHQCQTNTCSFTKKQRFNLLFVITTTIGLFGGINILLKLIIPVFITQFYKIFHNFHQQIVPYHA